MKYTGTAGILYDRLKSEILVADGAFGTYYAKKYDTGSLPELANLQASDRVLAIHKEYIEAGAKIIRTNTFASNTVCLGAGFNTMSCYIKMEKQPLKLSRINYFLASHSKPTTQRGLTIKPLLSKTN